MNKYRIEDNEIRLALVACYQNESQAARLLGVTAKYLKIRLDKINFGSTSSKKYGVSNNEKRQSKQAFTHLGILSDNE